MLYATLNCLIKRNRPIRRTVACLYEVCVTLHHKNAWPYIAALTQEKLENIFEKHLNIGPTVPICCHMTTICLGHSKKIWEETSLTMRKLWKCLCAIDHRRFQLYSLMTELKSSFWSVGKHVSIKKITKKYKVYKKVLFTLPINCSQLKVRFIFHSSSKLISTRLFLIILQFLHYCCLIESLISTVYDGFPLRFLCGKDRFIWNLNRT